MAVTIQFIIVAYEFFVIACTLSLAIGAFWFAISSTVDIKQIVHSVDKKVKQKRSERKMIKEFCTFIHMHSVVKQLSYL